MRLNRRPFERNERGVAIIEFALVLVMLLLVTIGITEFGRAFWYYSAIQKAARDGARCLSNTSWGGTPAEIITEQAAVDVCRTTVRDDVNEAGVSPALTLADIEMTFDGVVTDTSAWGNATKPEYVGIHVRHHMTWIWSIGSTLPQPGQNTTSDIYATMPMMK